MKLLLHTHSESSAGQRVRIALNLKGLTYACIPVLAEKTVSFRRMNPQGLMPVLEIDERPVAQSLAIIELIEELVPEPRLLPVEPFLRAQARAFAQLIASDLHPLNNRRVRRFLVEDFAVNAAQQDRWYRHWVGEAFAGLEAVLAGRPAPWRFCFSDTPGLADACLAPQMQKAREFGCDLSPYPLLRKVDATCRERHEFNVDEWNTDDVSTERGHA